LKQQPSDPSFELTRSKRNKRNSNEERKERNKKRNKKKQEKKKEKERISNSFFGQRLPFFFFLITKES